MGLDENGWRRQFRHGCRSLEPSACCRGRTTTGWMLCDIYFPNGKPVPFSARGARSRPPPRPSSDNRASTFSPGLEVEFQLFQRFIDPKLSPRRPDLAGRGAGGRAHPPMAFSISPESRFDQVDPEFLEVLRKTMQALDMPLLSHSRVELGPSPVRVHLRARAGPSRPPTPIGAVSAAP